MNREDVLRELELFPVWQLRVPLGKVESVATEIRVAEIMPAVATPAAPIIEAEFDYLQSENNAWIFICVQDDMSGSLIDTASQGMLFDNILTALQIKVKKAAINLADLHSQDSQSQDSQSQDSATVQNQVKVIVAMGEKTAQSLLNSSESIDDLRGKTHLLQNLPLVVTYSTAEILQHLPNKAKTWDDLCLALNIVNT